MGLGLLLLAASSLYGGVSKFQSSFTQSKLIENEGLLQQFDADQQAQLSLDEGYRLRQKQAMDYIGGGVELMGTPLLVLAETARRTELEAASMRETGRRMSLLAQEKAQVTMNEGRSALIASVFSSFGAYAARSK